MTIIIYIVFDYAEAAAMFICKFIIEFVSPN